MLSSNKKSFIQSIAFTKNKSEIWAVQYHPEFNPKWIASLMEQRKLLLLEEGIYKNTETFDNLSSFLSDIKKYKDQQNQLLISNTLIDKNIHTLELLNWIKNINHDI